MHRICKENNEKCIETNKDINLVLPHVTSTSIWPGILCPATILLNESMRNFAESQQVTLLYDHNEDHFIIVMVLSSSLN